jgi:cytidylate kinase
MAGARSLKMFAGKVIAIDGPAGSGKSTIARHIARRLGFEYLDSGALYRATAWIVMEMNLEFSKPEDLRTLFSNWDVDLRSEGDETRVFFGEQEITTAIRSQAVTTLVSDVADHPKIREFLVLWQRKRIAKGGVIIEGRDIGTVVAPKADVKIYLDAELHTRAERRLLEYVRNGIDTTLAEQIEKLTERDRRDKDRPVGSLRKAPDSITIDTTNMNIDQAADAAIHACRTRMTAATVTGERR